MAEYLSTHNEILRSSTQDLIDVYGFEVSFFKENPLRFAHLTAVMDTGDPLEPWAVAWYLSGDRVHLPADIMFEGLETQEGTVDDEYLHKLGSPAVAEVAELNEDAMIPLRRVV